MSERKCCFAHMMRRVAQTCGLPLILLISISPLIFGHALRAQASSVGTESTAPFDEIEAAASMGLSRVAQQNPNDQLLNALRGEVAALTVRLTAVEEDLQATRAMVRTAQRTSLVALFIVVLGISGSFGLQWGIIKRSRTSGLVGSAEGQGRVSTLPERRDSSPIEVSAMKKRVILISKLAFFLAVVYLNIWNLGPHSSRFVFEIVWSIGATFGAVVVIWHAESIRKALSLRSAGFLVASTLIWLLVYVLNSDSSTPRWLSGWILIVLGTILLTIAHAWLLGASRRRVLIAIPVIFGVYYLSAILLKKIFNVPEHIELFSEDLTKALYVIGWTMSVWQGAYLMCMFSRRPYWLFPPDS